MKLLLVYIIIIIIFEQQNCFLLQDDLEFLHIVIFIITTSHVYINYNFQPIFCVISLMHNCYYKLRRRYTSTADENINL